MVRLIIKLMTNLIFTEHVKFRIEQRDLDKELIREALLKPDRILAGKFGRSLAQKNIGGKILEVVYAKESGKTIVITAYFLKGGEDKK